MTVRYTIPKSGVTLEAEDLDFLLGGYAAIGGDRRFLEDHIKRSLASSEHGPAVAAAVEALGAHVIGTQQEVINEHGQEEMVEVDDPWASAPADRQTQPAKPPYRPQQNSGQQHRGDPAQFLGEDQWGGKFYTDPAAPQCSCGNQCIRKSAVSTKGNQYTAWVCFNAGPKQAGADYRQKCSFSEFPPRKGR